MSEGTPNGSNPATPTEPTKTPEGNGTPAPTPQGETIPKASYDVVAEKYRETKEKLEAIEKEKEEANKKSLEEQNKYKELYEAEQAKNKTAAEQLELNKKESAIKDELVKRSAKNASVVMKLLDLSKFKLAEDGSLEADSVKAELDKVQEAEPYLFGEEGKTNIGRPGGSPEGGATKPTTFKRSQLKDSKFYQEHEKEILEAMKNGNIIDDVSPAN